MKLRRNNWTEWKKYFKNLLVGRGHEEIVDNAWCLEHATEKIFRKKSALAFTLLHSCLSSDLKPIAAASETFADVWSSLGDTCGEKSLIKLGDKLYALVCCDFTPGSSITAHVARFQSLYTSLKSDLVSNENMKVTTTMAGIFFLKSFRNDNSLSALIQNMYDMEPFTFEKLAACMNIEHSQSESLTTGSINAVAKKNALMKPNKENFKAIPTSQRFCNVVPTKGRTVGKPGPRIPSSSSTMSGAEIQNLLEQQIEMLKKMQVNALDEDKEVDNETEEEVNAVDEFDPNDTGFFVNDEDSVKVISHDLAGN
jgi:hypothetical protein